MSRTINYKIDPNNNLIIVVLRNEITIDILLDFINHIINIPGYSEKFDMLLDMRNCNMNISPAELKKISDILITHPYLNTQRETIYLTNKPNEVVLSTLYSKIIQKTHINPHIISTVTKAHTILSRPALTVDKIEELISQL